MMRVHKSSKRGERGAALVEFTIGALVFLTATFGVLEFSRLLWTHNALSDAARRGARYAVNHKIADAEAVKNMVVYGNPDGTGTAIVNGLDTTNVDVDYKLSSIPDVGFGYPDGAVTVSITDFEFRFVVPILGTTMSMPDYRTTLTAESAGTIPLDITPTPTPEASPTPGPSGTPTPPPASPTPTPAPTASPTPAPTATPTPSPTPRSCNKGEKPEFEDCVCRPPFSVNPSSGKCN